MTKKVQYCACKINLAGQNCHTVIYNEFNPVSWPEVQVLMQLHGEENVMDIMPVGIGEVWPTGEKNRLASIYGSRVVETCFPGRAFRMDYMMTEETNLPLYSDGVLAGGEPKPEEPKPQPPPPPPKKDDNGDFDDGEDEDETAAAAAAAAGTPLPPIFKPGRSRKPEMAKGA
jgi:hypothetical protein